MKSKELKNPIEEARRYVTNAEENIEKAVYDPETKSYLDSKYVKTAGDILLKGCLIALDAVLHVRQGKGRPSIDGKLLAAIVIGYDILHLTMGYDGTKGKKVCDAGFEYANDIINRCAVLYNPEVVVA